MSTYIVDTSVTVAWYLEEVFSAPARVWQERLLGGQIRMLVPSLHYWEFANVLRTRAARGELSPELAAEIFDLHLDAPLAVVEPERRQVLTTALEFSTTAYDAVFIALCLANQAPLITAERTTTGWVTKLAALAQPIR